MADHVMERQDEDKRHSSYCSADSITTEHSVSLEYNAACEGDTDFLTDTLRGIYFNGSSRQLCDVVIKTQPLQQLPPLIHQHSVDIYSESQEQVDAFTHDFSDLGLGVELSRVHCGLEQGSNDANFSRTGFYHHGAHTIVPTHRYFLDKDSLRLSDSLLADLKQLQVLEPGSPNEAQFQSGCNRLFQKYGSHVYIGDIHFGGIYSEVTVGTGRDVRAVRRVVDAVFAAPSTPSGPIDVTSCTFSTGGEHNAPSLNEWKSELQNDHSLAAIIDRGKDVVGIWEILLNHRHDFREVKSLSKMLQTAWKDIQNDTSAHSKAGSQTMNPSHRTEETSSPAEEVQDLIKLLHLEEYYPEKITIRDVMQVGESVVKREGEIADIPRIILQKLIMLDRKGLTSEIKKYASTMNGSSDEDSSSCDSSTDLSELCDQDDQINPADVFLAIFLCCDLNLRQILVEKMNQCRLAFPFLFPDPHKKKLNLSLWALRNTKLAWRNASQDAIEASAVNCPLKVVSSLRYGRPDISKSKVISKVIDDEGEDCFLNETSPNGDIPRTFADGSVEGSFYLPAGKKTQNLKDAALFLNLRGDGLQHQTQVRILSQMSTVMLVYLDVSDLEKHNVQSEMNYLSQHCKEVVMVLSSHTKGISKEKVESLLRNFKGEIGKSLPKILAFTKDGKKNEDQLKNDVRQKVLKSISDAMGIVLGEQHEMMLRLGVSIDEMNQCCQEGKAYADRVVSCLEGSNRETSKADFLPLQGESWKEWCKLLKRKKRLGQQTGIQAIGEVEKQMSDHRTDQGKLCDKLSSLTQAFIDGLTANIDSPSLHFYMQWLRMFLDDFSQKELHPLLQEYQTLVTILSEAKDKKEGDIPTMEEDMKNLEDKIDNANFGIEHLLREIGQAYEATADSRNKDLRRLFCKLPVLAAKLILKGYALEIMDGNALGVPLTWLQAVFAELEKQLENQKLFSLSVLGLQSSGKSTLLNTMFGLQLPVSAGRCTTGVYMQLVKVRDGSNLPFKYLAVFDTEGLRSPEMSESNYSHDNELATFVIGLGNLTMMNIKGENVSDAKDILQVVTHAFLRMMMVNERIQRDRSCVFVHQNVPAFDAKEKNQIGSQRFGKALDKKTEEAASMENITGINRFNQIIKFDKQKHIWYFPDLWHGVPPMASVNTGYHERTMELKAAVLESHATDDQYLFSTAAMIDFIADMWNSVLTDDFVFGFRNSLVIKAYKELANKCSELKWSLEKEYSEWITMKRAHVEVCNTQDSLELLCDKLKEEAEAIIKDKAGAARSELKTFVETNSQKELMHSWEKDRSSSLQSTAELLCFRAQKDIDKMQAKQKVNIMQNIEQGLHKQEILSMVEKLANNLRGTQDHSLIEREFDNLWKHWLAKQEVSSEDKDPCIEDHLVRLLYEHFPHNRALITSMLERNPFAKPSLNDHLEGSMTTADIRKADMKISFTRFFQAHEMKRRAVDALNSIFGNVDAYLANVSKRSDGFQEHEAKEVLQKVDFGLRQINEDKSQPFKIQINLEAQIAVHVFTHAIRVFASVQEYYVQNYSIAAKLQDYRKTAWKVFQQQMTENTDMEAIAAEMVCDQLEPLMKIHVQRQLHAAVVDRIVSKFSNKEYLIKSILQSLAELDSFRAYTEYISDTKTFVSKCLVDQTDRFMFSESGQSNWYVRKARKLLDKLTRELGESSICASEMSHGKTTIGSWIASFSEILHKSHQSVAFTHTKVPHIDDCEVQTSDNIQTAFTHQLKIVTQKVLKHFKGVTSETIRWHGRTPYEQIIDALWGCEAVCPFCQEPCMKSDANHASPTDCHECVQHRPQGVAYQHWRDTEQLVAENCNYLVQSNATFSCHGTTHTCDVQTTDEEEIYHRSKQYKKFMPDWHIMPSPDMGCSDYWKWFLCEYKAQLAEASGTNEPDIPVSWTQIDKHRALESLDS